MRALLIVAIAIALVFTTHFASAQLTVSGCMRPTDPGGVDDYDYGSATIQSFGNTDVLVWYVTTGPNAVNTKSSRADSVPDDVAEVAQVTSDALASYAKLGFRAPVSDADASCGSNGGDGRLDIYLVNMIGADGMTATDSGRCTAAGAASRCASFIFAQSNFAEYYATSDIGIHTVLPHETFHTVQNAYDAKLDRFWAEGTAQWAAKTLDPSLTDLERFLPDFFSQTSRSLDAPSNGVVSAFLYGAAIWPVFLTQRHGDDIVRLILEQEGIAGGVALDATDVILKNMQSSMAADFPLFAAWNAATGTRTGTGGYTNAASYPMVSIAELDGSSAQGTTSGYATFYFHAKVDSPMTIALDTDATRNAGTIVPLENGVAHADETAPLPASVDDEGVVVVSGITSNKTDAPFTVSLTAIADAGTNASTTSSSSSSGCAIADHTGNSDGFGGAIAIAVLALARRRKKSQCDLFVRSTCALAFLFIASCSRSHDTPSADRGAVDTAKRDRIVSAGGAVTETIFALGAGDRVVGVDTSSLYPDAATKLAHIGYQRTLAAEGILALAPTLVIASAEAGPPAALDQLRSAGVRVEVIPSDPSIDGAKARITKVAQILGQDPAAALSTFDADLARANAFVAKTTTRPKVLALYARGENALFVFGRNTAAESMLKLAGADDAITSFEGSKPLTSESVVQAAPDVILLPARGLESMGGLDGLMKLPGIAQTPAGKAKRVVTMDDLLLLGFGPRTGQAVLELATKLHPEIASEAAR